MSLLEQHQKDIVALSDKMKRFYQEGTPIKIYHGSTNSTRAQTFDPKRVIDVSAFSRVITVNEKKQYVIVESNVPMDVLVRETLKHGLIPPVVMEFPGITVGGGIQGGAYESSSFKEGLFHECAIEYELLLGNGDIVTVSRQENSDLFWGTACSYGTIAIMTLIKLRLVPATNYVELTYRRVDSFKDSIRAIKDAAGSTADFIDGIIYSKSRGVIMTGVRTDEKRGSVVTFSKARDDWFYLHADKISQKHVLYTEIIPLVDYLFRYNRGGFWVGWYGFKRWSVPFNRVTRFLFNPFLKTRELYDILHATNTAQQYVVQDISLPEETAEQFLDFVHRDTAIYPLWLCPLKPDTTTFLSPADIQTPLVIDVGVWGELSGGRWDYQTLYSLNRKMENITEMLHGRKLLYAHAYYPKDQFWNIYNHKKYDALREKYFAANIFPDIYEKTYVSEHYRSEIKKGLRKLILKKIKKSFGL